MAQPAAAWAAWAVWAAWICKPPRARCWCAYLPKKTSPSAVKAGFFYGHVLSGHPAITRVEPSAKLRRLELQA